LVLHDRNDCLIKPTVREKVLTYLIKVATTQKNRTLTVPFDRSAMAEYLNVDRSALSRELSRMRKDGLIDFYKNNFRLLHVEGKKVL
jgi:CRP-like cAMP-binding protein